MSRILCLIFGLCLVSAPVVIMNVTDDLSAGSLALACGGNPGFGKGSVACDEEAGVYTGCTMEFAFCQGCGTENEDGSLTPTTANIPDPGAPKGKTGYMLGQKSQDCGTISAGFCVADITKPTGFFCDAVDSGDECSQGILEVVPQPKPVFVADPLDPAY